MLELLAFLLPTLFFSVFFLRKIGVPTIIGYILVGSMLAYFFPYLKNMEEIKELEFFKEFAVALLFFYIGMEFPFKKIIEGIKSYKLALIDFIFNFIPLLLISILFFPLNIAVLIALALYPSSTAIIINLMVESKRLVNKETTYLINILILEDLITIIALIFLAPILKGESINLLLLAGIVLKLFLVALAFFIIKKKFLGYIKKLFLDSQTDDYFILFLTGFILLSLVLSKELGIIEYLGPFLFGSLIAEIKKENFVTKYLISFKEFTLAIFFFLFGLNLNINEINKESLIPILLLSSFAILFKILSTYIALKSKLDKESSIRGALSFIPRGEFSIVLSSLNKNASIIALPVIIITILVGTILFKISDKIAKKLSKN